MRAFGRKQTPCHEIDGDNQGAEHDHTHRKRRSNEFGDGCRIANRYRLGECFGNEDDGDGGTEHPDDLLPEWQHRNQPKCECSQGNQRHRVEQQQGNFEAIGICD